LLNETFISDCRLFPDIYISQGNVATRFRYGGIFNDSFIARLLLSLIVKEFVKIGQHLLKLWATKYRVVFL